MEAEKAGEVFRGWVCGLPTERTSRVGVEDFFGRRLGQFVPEKARLLQRSHNLVWKRVVRGTPPPRA